MQLLGIYKKAFCSIFLIIFALFFLKSSIYASDEFATSYDVTYSVSKDGITTTKQIVTLRNKFDYIYATEYSVTVGSNRLTDITAQDAFGSIDPLISVNQTTTNIKLIFNENIVGKDRTQKIVITYKTPDFATVKGKVLEVGFPLIAKGQELENYSITVEIPNEFDRPTQLLPEKYVFKRTVTGTAYTFSKDVLVNKKGITGTFGTEQILDFVLRYSLENKELFNGKTEIALPSDSAYQTVLYDSIIPAPNNVTVDPDGNWLAEYILQPQSKVTVSAKGTVKINYFPKPEFARELTPEERAEYTKEDEYWQTTNTDIATLANKLKTPEAIYNHLVSNFIYDYGRLDKSSERYGAVKAIANANNVICTEFTDTFIALARAVGIPAREHNGYAYTENDKLRPLSFAKDILHAWPEYYDDTTRQWKQIDPTWGNTTGGLDFFNKFDLDHFSFVTHGYESNYPVTAAAYRTADTEGKDIQITFGASFTPKTILYSENTFSRFGISGFPLKGSILLKNTGNASIYNNEISIKIDNNFVDLWHTSVPLPVIPPYATLKYPVIYHTQWSTEPGTYHLEINTAGNRESLSFTVKQYIKPEWLFWGISLLAGFGLFSISYKIGYVFNTALLYRSPIGKRKVS